MQKLKAHPKAIVAAGAINGVRTRYSIEGVAGLLLDCQPNGQRSWLLRYSVGSGRRERKEHTRRLGSANEGDADRLTLAQVRIKATELKRVADLDAVNPLAPEEIVPTFGMLAEDWLVKHAKAHKRSWKDDDGRYRGHIASRLGHLAVDTPTPQARRQIDTALDEIAEDVSGVTANRCLAIISAVYNWAIDVGRAVDNPARRMRKRAQERHRERVLSDDEIRRLWAALGPSRTDTRIKLLLLLGQRRSEVACARQEEFNNSTWTVPAARSKNSVANVVPMTAFSFDLFGDKRPMNAMSLTERFIEVANSLRLEDVRLHDLRHTLKTRLAELGVPVDISDRVTNHVTGQRRRVGATYDQYSYMAEKRRALELWERRLLEIVEGRPASGERW